MVCLTLLILMMFVGYKYNKELPIIEFKNLWLIIIMIIIPIVASNFAFISSGISIIIIALFIWLNKEYKSIVIIGIGTLLNYITIFVNNGKMPVDARIAQQIGENVVNNKHIITSNANLYFLSDVIFLPDIFAFKTNIISIGDIVIFIGLLILSFHFGNRIKNLLYKGEEN